MVRIAIAGGSGQVAREVIDALLAEGKHTVVILSRRIAGAGDEIPNVEWRVVNYDDHRDLAQALQKVHTLLSFLQLLHDPDGKHQKNLIDAAIIAGVQRFAPSEYASAGTTHMPWWAGKESTRQYLRQVNANKKLLEYTLFQPGLFLDYLSYPYKTSKHIDPLQSVFDYQNCRAIMVDGYEDAIMTLTSAADVATTVARAVSYGGEWPESGGISGNRMTFSQIVKIGEKIRGRPFTIDKVTLTDLQNGVLKTSWALEKQHQAVSDDQHVRFVKAITIGILLSSVDGAWDVSDAYNRLFPGVNFDRVEDFLAKVWEGKS